MRERPPARAMAPSAAPRLALARAVVRAYGGTPAREDPRMKHRIRNASLATLLAAASAASPAQAGDRDAQARGCARQFDAAQRIDMESFRDYDAEAFRAIHDERATSVFGQRAFIGIDAIMQALASHFANREARYTWVEQYRVVDGCKSAFILYETVYEIPRTGFRARALTGVSYTRSGNHWLALSDMGTPLPP